MKPLKIIGFVLLVLLVLAVLLGLIAPQKVQVERSVNIQAPKALVFSHVQYWRNWQAWSPWAAMDSTMKGTIEGKDGSPGSVYRWVSKKVGTGGMTNTAVQPNEKLDYRLKFVKPFASESDGYIKVADDTGGTKVSWAYIGRLRFPWNILNLLVGMDKQIGKDFEKGLVLLKDLCEKEASEVLKYQVKEIPFPARSYAAVRKTVAIAQMKDFFAQSYPAIMQALGKMRARMSGAPCGLYFTYDEQTGMSDMAAAIPILGGKDSGEITLIRVPAGKACEIDYLGSYEKMANAYTAMELYLAKKGLKQKMPVIEEYLTDPMREPDPAKWLTKIYFLVE